MMHTKIKSNQYAELLAQQTDSGDIVFLTAETRLNTTQFGELFMGLIREAVRSGKFDSATKLVDFCEIATNAALHALATNPALAIEAPPRSVIARKVAKAKGKKDTDNA